MSTTDMTNPWRRGSKKAGAKNKRRAAIVRAQGRRKAKAECRHIERSFTYRRLEADRPAVLVSERCLDCGARLSLGPSNDRVPREELEVAEVSWLFPSFDAWLDETERVVFWEDDGEGWPWDPSRPVAGQYFGWLGRAGICDPGDDAFAQLCKTELDAANADNAAKQNALDAHGCAKPGEPPAEVVGLDAVKGSVDFVCDDSFRLPGRVASLEEQRAELKALLRETLDADFPTDSDAPAATYEPGGAE